MNCQEVEVTSEPLTPHATKRWIRSVLDEGKVIPSKHARQEMAKDKLDLSDCLNVLRAGTCEPGENENGSWRYRVATSRMCVVVARLSDTELMIVTAWRFRS